MMKRLHRLNEIVGRIVIVTLVTVLGICAAICLCALLAIRWAFAVGELPCTSTTPPRGLEDIRHTMLAPVEKKRSDSCLS